MRSPGVGDDRLRKVARVVRTNDPNTTVDEDAAEDRLVTDPASDCSLVAAELDLADHPNTCSAPSRVLVARRQPGSKRNSWPTIKVGGIAEGHRVGLLAQLTP